MSTVPLEGGKKRRNVIQRAKPVKQPPSLPVQQPLFPEAEPTIDETLLAEFGGDDLDDVNRLLQAAEYEPNDPNSKAEKAETRVKRQVIRRGKFRKNETPVYPMGSISASRDIYPLTAPGMPLPGADLMELAAALGDDTVLQRKGKNGKPIAIDRCGLMLPELVREVLYASGDVSIPITVRAGVKKDLAVVSGHLWKSAKATGPVRADVMVIGKMLGGDDKHAGCGFSGRIGELLRDVCDELGVGTDADNWYMTNLMKTEHPEAAAGNTTIKNPQVNEWLPILHQELRLVQPKYILCLGADSLKALLGKKASVAGMEGRVVEYTFPVSRTPDERQINHTSLLMACMHPAAVLHAPEQEDTFKNGFARFYQLTRGLRPDREEEDLDHRAIETLDELKALYHEIQRDVVKNRISLDAEWHGDHPQNEGAYMRTIQLSWKPKTAVCIHLRHPGGKWRFQGKRSEIVHWLLKICRGKRLVGQFLTADLEWLIDFGLGELAEIFTVPDTWEETYRRAHSRKPTGGFDTGLALHAIRETGDFGLTAATLRYTTAPRYDVELVKWRDRYCNERGLKKEDMEGYGEVEDGILVPYACLHKDSKVQLADGSWKPIGELVRNKYDGYVRSLFEGKVVDRKVTGWHRNDVGQQDWRKIITEGSATGRRYLEGPAFTPDHKVLTTRGRVRVDQLKVGEDRIWTAEPDISSDQLSVLLGSLLGDGGFRFRSSNCVGFGFGQSADRSEYCDWKAYVFRNLEPRLRRASGRRYELKASKLLLSLSRRFSVHDASAHSKRKLVVTQDVLDNLGDLGLAVWYQDDGSLVRCGESDDGYYNSRIYCRLTEPEERLLLDWFRTKFGSRVTYKRSHGFFQFCRESHQRLHETIAPYIHPCVAYKAVSSAGAVYETALAGPRSELVTGVETYSPTPSHRGNGVRYCLTVEGAHNFLTQVGFVSNCYDADVTWRLVDELERLLDCDGFGNNCWEPFWRSMRAQPAALEMSRTGLLVDRERMDRQTETYMAAKARLEQRLRDWIRWPDMNINSVFQVREFLFGEELNGKQREPGSPPIRLRPPGARSLKLKPVFSSDKRPIPWDEVLDRNQQDEKSPSTNKIALAILAQENQEVERWHPKLNKFVTYDFSEQVTWLRDLRFVAQVLKSVLRVPKKDEETQDFIMKNGFYVYPGGLPEAICDDDVVRTHLYQTKETGRWSSARPPLQNLSKKREADYARILGDAYIQPIRTFMRARPGHVLMEADYTGAELFGMAMLSGDEAMIEHARRNILPENDPDYYDIHSNVAKLAFKLDCAPTKGGLKAIGKGHMRIVAKSVVFGVAYGRGAKAIALAAKEEGVQVTVAEAQQVIDALFEMYPRLRPFFEACKRRAIEERWMCGVGGRFRRFPLARDRMQIGDMERQGMNFMVQNLVAETMNVAIDNLLTYRKNHDPDLFKMVLQIHDAILLEVPFRHAEHVYDEVLPLCMSELAPIYPVGLDGMPLGTGPYHLGIGRDVNVFWGQEMSPADLWELDLSPHLGGWIETEKGFVHPEKDGKIWVGNRQDGGQLVKLEA